MPKKMRSRPEIQTVCARHGGRKVTERATEEGSNVKTDQDMREVSESAERELG